ncbi:MAG: threonine--tRNA ligase [Verrucomicrobia bacterium]|nr:threonine--tRNA ligase [Verrucomicrobiota bacterium]MDA1087486.1 threonine--tRNA ligase [Verrucomicrobiota bacterium]
MATRNSSYTSSELYALRHSAAHVMAAAVCRVFKDVRLDIGPPTESGFYYDFDLADRLAPEDFDRIEKEMHAIMTEDVPFECKEMQREEAEAWLRERGQTYKVERLADIPEGEAITFYTCGDFTDLCRGPHVESTGRVKAFKLLSVAGSYYRGKETNPMLQRIYGTASQNDKQLKVQLKQIEEAKQRDHRRIGKDLDLFSIQEDVGGGLVHWHPRGARIRSIVEDFWKREHFKAGYHLLYTPHIGQAKLWEKSGHLALYKEMMYSPMEFDDTEYYVKPMNCPFHIQVYKSHMRSYRDLPLRYAELGAVYRYEKAGVLHGLFRVRGFTQDDSHIFCTPETVEDEIREVVRFAQRIWRAFEFEDITAYLATRPEKAVGEDDKWAQATASLENALKAEGISYEVDPGGGAFYGPKIDLKVRDAIGREWQMSTVQFDFNLPERFDLSYIAEDGQPHQPYMVHRALLGSLERFFGVLIEHFAGAFPFWLAPEQVRLLPLTDHQVAYAEAVQKQLDDEGFRVDIDRNSEKIGAKIRRAQLDKVPVMLICGPKEVESTTVSVRLRTEGDRGAMSLDDLLVHLKAQEAPGDSQEEK